jgi:1,4-alpha-glucan branching enzyme
MAHSGGLAMAKAKPKAEPMKKPAKKRVTFTLTAPDARVVAVTGSFCGWLPDVHMLKPDGDGKWTKMLLLEPGRYEYRFIVDGVWCNDQNCPERVANSYGSENSVLSVG